MTIQRSSNIDPPSLSGVRIYRSLDHRRGLAASWVMLFHAIGTQERTLYPAVELFKIPARLRVVLLLALPDFEMRFERWRRRFKARPLTA